MENSPGPDPIAGIRAECARIQESAQYSAQGQFESSKAWRVSNWLLGGLTAIASGVAGVLTFASDGLQIVSGGLALLAALTASIHATLKPDKKAERAQNSANEYLSIQSAARRFLTIDIPIGQFDQLREGLGELAKRADSINKSADAIPGFAYRRAQSNIDRGGQTYRVDEADSF